MTNAPYVYDFFSETNRSRKSINQEIRILSRRADFDRGLRHEWVTGIYYLDIKLLMKNINAEINLKENTINFYFIQRFFHIYSGKSRPCL